MTQFVGILDKQNRSEILQEKKIMISIPEKSRNYKTDQKLGKSQGISFSHLSGTPDFLLQIYKRF